jgi:hypothetical protein
MAQQQPQQVEQHAAVQQPVHNTQQQPQPTPTNLRKPTPPPSVTHRH